MSLSIQCNENKKKPYRFEGSIHDQGMAIRRRILIVIFCDVFAAGLWYLRGCGLTGPTSRTPSSPIKVIVRSHYFINSTTVILQNVISECYFLGNLIEFSISFCIPLHVTQIGNHGILFYVLK